MPQEESGGIRKECLPRHEDGVFGMVGYPMESFVRSLERRVGRPVTNETGLSGTVDLNLPDSVASTFTRRDRVDVDSQLFTALEDVLALRLESRRAPIAVLVVEHIERPEEN